MKLFRFALPLAVAATLMATSASAFAWDLLGIRTVSKGIDRDSIRVAGNNRHRQFRMCVRLAGVHVRHIRIRFNNGGSQDVSVRRYFAPGTCTRAVDLKGNRRNIRRIDIAYNRVNSQRLPLVGFWAR